MTTALWNGSDALYINSQGELLRNTEACISQCCEPPEFSCCDSGCICLPTMNSGTLSVVISGTIGYRIRCFRPSDGTYQWGPSRSYPLSLSYNRNWTVNESFNESQPVGVGKCSLYFGDINRFFAANHQLSIPLGNLSSFVPMGLDCGGFENSGSLVFNFDALGSVDCARVVTNIGSQFPGSTSGIAHISLVGREIRSYNRFLQNGLFPGGLSGTRKPTPTSGGIGFQLSKQTIGGNDFGHCSGRPAATTQNGIGDFPVNAVGTGEVFCKNGAVNTNSCIGLDVFRFNNVTQSVTISNQTSCPAAAEFLI